MCGSTESVVTQEHIPPKSAGNRGSHRVETLRFGRGQGGETLLLDGFSLRVLCEHCNNRYGSTLGTTFASFVQQVQRSGRFVSPRGGVFVSAIDVYPSRVFRQLLLNFLCVQPTYDPDRWESVREYVRSRNVSVPPEAPHVGLYYNVANTYRVVPIGSVTSLGRGRAPWIGLEIAAPGLGVVFTLGDPAEVNPMIMPKLFDISSWGEFDFGHKTRVVLELSRYSVQVPHPLAYGSHKDVDKWQDRNLIAWAATPFDTDTASDVGAILWRPEGHRRSHKRRP
jgi:hypothetical protein